jgi:DNA modification methylase
MTDKLRIEYRRVDALIPYARNSRTHSDGQVAQIAASIREFGFTNPVLVDGENGIIAGHGRVLAARKLGLEQVPVIELAHLDEAQRRAYVIADNKLALNAGWSDELLKIELGALQEMDFDLDLLGFDGSELAELLAEPEVEELPPGGEDSVPEVQEEAITQKGNVWLLGKHRILCGDCRDFNDVAKVLDGQKINVAVTSPPYASQREYDPSSGFNPIHPDEFSDWYRDVAANIMANLADDGSYFMNIKEHAEDGQRHLYVKDLLIAHVREWGWLWIDEYVWLRAGIPGDAEMMGRFKNGWESVFWFAKARKPKFNPKDVRHHSDSVFSYADQVAAGAGISASKQGRSDNKKVGGHEGLAYPSNVLELKQNAEALGHSAAFPVALPDFFIKANSDAGDVVYDPFMGSGTTMIAAENEGRVACGTELSPRYVDVIVRRWEKLTGKQAMLEGDGRTFDEIAAERKS